MAFAFQPHMLVIVHPSSLDAYFGLCESAVGLEHAIALTKVLEREMVIAAEQAQSVVVLDQQWARRRTVSDARMDLYRVLKGQERVKPVLTFQHDEDAQPGAWQPWAMQPIFDAIKRQHPPEIRLAGLWCSNAYRACVDTVGDMLRKRGHPTKRIDAACGWEEAPWEAAALLGTGD